MIDYDDTRFKRYPVPADEMSESVPDCWFSLDTQYLSIALLRCVEGLGCYQIGQELFTGTEFPLVAELFANAPWHTPTERLYAVFYYGEPTEEKVDRARTHLLHAYEEGVYDQEARPLRNALSRTRLKMHRLGITVVSITSVGYMLRRYSHMQERVYGSRGRT